MALTLEAPPAKEFAAVLRHVRGGQRLRRGLDGVGSRERARKLEWALSEAMRERDAHFLVRTAQCVWFARDARHGRLLFRFRAVGFKNRRLEVRAGVLGHTKDFGTGAANIVRATHCVLTRFLTTGGGKPRCNVAQGARAGSELCSLKLYAAVHTHISLPLCTCCQVRHRQRRTSSMLSQTRSKL